MQWDDSPHAGFTTGTPWLPRQPEPTRRSTPRPRWPTRTRCSTTTAASSSCATASTSWWHGRFDLLLPEHEQVFAYTRTLEADGRSQTLLVVANMASGPVGVDLPGQAAVLAGELLLTTHPDGAPADGERVRLAPWESRVYLA